MDLSLSYPYEKFLVAISTMACGTGSLQTRLYDAYLSFHTIREEHFDDAEMARLYRRILEALTLAKDGRDGSVAATTKRMNDQEAREVAKMIVLLFSKINAAYLENKD